MNGANNVISPHHCGPFKLLIIKYEEQSCDQIFWLIISAMFLTTIDKMGKKV